MRQQWPFAMQSSRRNIRPCCGGVDRMSFWFGKIVTPELANRIVRYCGIGWIIWACLCVVITALSESPEMLLGAVFGFAAARACSGHSRTATLMIFGIVAFSAGVNILGLLGHGTGFPLLTAAWLLVWFALALSAFRVVKAIEFLNAEDLKAVGSA